MLTRLVRLPLRRCLHTAPRASVHPSFYRYRLILGASAAAAAFFTWRLTSDSHRITLDSQQATTTPPDELESDTEDESPPTEPQTESESAEGSAAYDPVTGKINWDCPCLGGMAHGPCGPEFKEAFACFVYSEDEPKGINCVEKFKAMQDCFRLHPDIYGDDIMEDENVDSEVITSDGDTDESSHEDEDVMKMLRTTDTKLTTAAPTSPTVTTPQSSESESADSGSSTSSPA